MLCKVRSRIQRRGIAPGGPADRRRTQPHPFRPADGAILAQHGCGQSRGRRLFLLQISSDERQRVTRVSGLFSEEDLTRHLQIMLRTHGELGYRQEQRFHLELGLLKMAHAQRLLPIEQLLSEAGDDREHAAASGQTVGRT